MKYLIILLLVVSPIILIGNSKGIKLTQECNGYCYIQKVFKEIKQ